MKAAFGDRSINSRPVETNPRIDRMRSAGDSARNQAVFFFFGYYRRIAGKFARAGSFTSLRRTCFHAISIIVEKIAD